MKYGLEDFFGAGTLKRSTAAAPKKAAPKKAASSTASAKKAAPKAAPKAKKAAAPKPKLKLKGGSASYGEMDNVYGGSSDTYFTQEDSAESGDTYGGGELGQSLRDLAVPFGLVLAKAGYEAWIKSRKESGKVSSKTSKTGKTGASKTGKTGKPKAVKKLPSRRRYGATGGGAETAQEFNAIYDSINSFIDSDGR